MGVDLICEVQCGGAVDYRLLVALGREHDYLGAHEVLVYDVQQLQCADVAAEQDFLNLPQPFVHFGVVLGHVAVLLVGPVGGDSLFGDVVHALRAYLDLYPYSGVAHERAVQRLVAVVLRP